MEDTTLLALVGMGSTASVAWVGLGLQFRLAHRQAKWVRAEARYSELIDVYAKAGALGSTVFTAILALSRSQQDLTHEKLYEALSGDAFADARHVGSMLYLHGVPDEVSTAYDSWITAALKDPMPSPDAPEREWMADTLTYVRSVGDALGLFYRLAGDHARSVRGEIEEKPLAADLMPTLYGLTRRSASGR